MKKLLFTLIPAVLILIGCFKPNSTTPITSIQQKMNGNWQVDSTFTISYDMATNPVTDSVFIKRTTHDSLFKNHLLNISNSGTTVTITMAEHNTMRYTISGTSLSPFVSTSSLPTLNFAHGCGLDYVQSNDVAVTDHSLVISSYQSGIRTDTSITYMHR